MEKIALVTGASRGIGRACALRLAADGMQVIVNYRSGKEAADKTVEEIRAKGGEAVALQADVSDLPFSAESFDLATAFETIYFWPGLEKCFAEVAKVLKEGGCFLICNESDGTDATGTKFEEIIDGMHCYTAQQIEDALKAAGFTEVHSGHHPSKPWIAVLAKK